MMPSKACGKKAGRVIIGAWALVLVLGLAAGPAGAADQDHRPLVVAQAGQAQQTVFHGNVKSRKFHRPLCRYYDCKNCTAVFKTREQAIQAGYVPCKVCKP